MCDSLDTDLKGVASINSSNDAANYKLKKVKIAPHSFPMWSASMTCNDNNL